MHEAHDALLCIAQGRTMAERDRWRVTPEQWFKPPAAMRALFADLPEACDNTVAIARRCAVMAETRRPLLPVCPKVRAGSTEDETLRAMAEEGLERRLHAMQADADTAAPLPRTPLLRARRDRRMGFPGYLHARRPTSSSGPQAHDIPVGPGRGSGAGSLAPGR